LFTLFDIAALIPALEEPLKTFSGTIGAYNENVTFIGNVPAGFTFINEIVRICLGRSSFVDPAQTAEFVNQILAMLLVIIILISVFTDFIGLIAGNKNRKNGAPNPHKGWFVFAAIRYSLIIVLIAAAVVLSFVLDGFGKVGIYMYFTVVLVLITFIVEIIRYCVGKSKVKAYEAEKKAIKDSEELIIEDETLAEEKAEEATPSEVTEQYQTNIFGDEPVEQAEPAAETVEEEQPSESVGEQLSIMDAESVEEEVEPVVVNETEVEAEEPATAPAEAEVVEETPVQEVETVAVEEKVEEVETTPAPTTFNLFGEEEAEDNKSIDPFIDKLTDEERAQFYDVFINRNQGKFSSIPVYKLNENNSDFFPAVFVHINRMRNLCSDSLLAKIYKEIGKD
ncbi:MAG: hypothetical protein ACI4MC_00005, partial [Candidatus Coproplasma sp.]